MLALFAVVLLALGMVGLALSLRRARRFGTLSFY
jgi:hypothetical protein